MNVGKSTKIALIKNDKSLTWLAEKMGVSYVRASAYCNVENCATTTLQRLAKVFDMPVSEFCELSEETE